MQKIITSFAALAALSACSSLFEQDTDHELDEPRTEIQTSEATLAKQLDAQLAETLTEVEQAAAEAEASVTAENADAILEELEASIGDPNE